jgi:phage-related minor tail protein
MSDNSLGQLGSAAVAIVADLSTLKPGLDSAKTPVQEAARSLGDLFTKEFQKALKDSNENPLAKFGENLTEMGGKAKEAGKALTELAVPFEIIGGGAFEAAEKIEAAMNTIRVGTGATGEKLEELGASFKTVFAAVPNSTEDVGRAIADLHVRADLSGKALEEMATQLLNVSRITKGDIGANVSATTRLFRGWTDAAKDQAGSLDYLFKVSQQTNIGFTTLNDLMVRFKVPLQQLGFDFEHSAAMLGNFEKAGVNVDQAMMALSLGLNTLAEHGAQDAGATMGLLFDKIKHAKSDVEGTAIAIKVFGARAGKELGAAIRSGKLDVDGFVESLKNNKETINAAAEDAKTFGDKIAELGHKMMEALAPLGLTIKKSLESWMPTIQSAIGTVAKLVEGFGHLPQSLQTIILVGGALAAAAGPTLFGIGLLSSIVGEAIAGLSALAGVFAGIAAVAAPVAAPIAVVVAALAALGGAAYLVYKNWDTVKGALVGVWNSVKGAVLPAVTGIEKALTDTWNEIRETLKHTWADIVSNASGAWSSLKTSIAPILEAVKDLWDRWGGTILSGMATVRDGIGVVFSTIGSIVGNAFRAVGAVIAGALNAIVPLVKIFVGGLTGNWSLAWEGMQGVVKAAWGAISGVVSAGLKIVADYINNFLGFWATTASKVASALPSAVSGPVQTLADKLRSGADAAKGFGDALQSSAPKTAQAAGEIKKVGESSKEAATAAGEHGKAIGEAAKATAEHGKAAKASAHDQDVLNAVMTGTKTAAEQYDEKLKEMKKSLTEANFEARALSEILLYAQKNHISATVVLSKFGEQIRSTVENLMGEGKAVKSDLAAWYDKAKVYELTTAALKKFGDAAHEPKVLADAFNELSKSIGPTKALEAVSQHLTAMRESAIKAGEAVPQVLDATGKDLIKLNETSKVTAAIRTSIDSMWQSISQGRDAGSTLETKFKGLTHDGATVDEAIKALSSDIEQMSARARAAGEPLSAFVQDLVRTKEVTTAVEEAMKKLGEQHDAPEAIAATFAAVLSKTNSIPAALDAVRDKLNAVRAEAVKTGKDLGNLNVIAVLDDNTQHAEAFKKSLEDIKRATQEASLTLADLRTPDRREQVVTRRTQNVVTTSELHQAEASVNLDAFKRAAAEYLAEGKSMAEVTQLIGSDYVAAAETARKYGIAIDETTQQQLKQIAVQQMATKGLEDIERLKQLPDIVVNAVQQMWLAGANWDAIIKVLGPDIIAASEAAKELHLQLPKTTKDQLEAAAADARRAQAAKEFQQAMTQAMGQLIADFNRGLTDAIFHAKSFGEAIKDVFLNASKNITTIILTQMTAPLTEAMQGLGKKLAGLFSDGGVFGNLFNKLGDKISGMFGGLGENAGKKIGGLIGSVAGPLAAAGIGAAISAITNAIGKGRRTANKFGEEVQNPFGADLGKDVAAFNALASSGHASAKQLLDAYNNVRSLIDQFKTDAGAFAAKGSTEAKVVKQAWDTMTQNFGPDFVKILGPMGDKLKELGVDVTQSAGDIDKAAQVLDNFESSVESIVSQTTASADSADVLVEAIKRLQDAGVPLKVILDANGDAIRNAVDQLKDLGRDVPDTLQQMADAIDQLGDSAAEGTRKFNDAVASIVSSTTSYADNANVLEEALKQLIAKGTPTSLIIDANGDAIAKTAAQLTALGKDVPPNIAALADQIAKTSKAAKDATTNLAGNGVEKMLHDYAAAYAHGFEVANRLSPSGSSLAYHAATTGNFNPSVGTISGVNTTGQPATVNVQHQGVVVNINGDASKDVIDKITTALETNQRQFLDKTVLSIKRVWNGVGPTR